MGDRGSDLAVHTAIAASDDVDPAARRLQWLVGIAGVIYLAWWFLVELVLPGSYNPLLGRLVVVCASGALVVASLLFRWVLARLSTLFAAWTCLLVAHYFHLLIGNQGDATWWVGAFVTLVGASMCLSSLRDVVALSVFALACAVRAAAIEGQLRHSIYVPGLATILLLATITKHHQVVAQEATRQAERSRIEKQRADERRLGEVRRAKEAVEAANRDLEAFNYSVAHDLRAPLRGIDGFSQALLEDYQGRLDATGESHLRRVREAAQHMGRLIDGMLALARVTRVGITHDWVDLSALARAAADRLRETEPDRKVEVVVAGGLRVKGDPALLGAVVDNLLANAWKFTRKRSDARIEVGSKEEGGETAYFVRDNGAGFDMAYKSKLFGVFQRLHATSEFEGTGVGLATVQRIVSRHGGRVWAEGKVGEGACFSFTCKDPAPGDRAL
jgi:signal transduction histidine kinase